MKLKLLGGAALAAACAASGAWAMDGWYGAVDAGVHQPFNIHATSSDSPELRIKTEATNAVVFFKIGYRFSPYIRLELEGGTRPASVKGVQTLGVGPNYQCGQNTTLTYSPVTGSFSGYCSHPTGHADAWTVMGNVLIDPLPQWRFSPFIGGGIGVIWPKYRSAGVAIGPQVLGGSEDYDISGVPSEFAYQGLGGVSYRVNDRVNIDLTYRYLSSEHGSLTAVSIEGKSSNIYTAKYEDQSLTLGVRVAIGTPPAPAAPPPSAAPSASAAAASPAAAAPATSASSAADGLGRLLPVRSVCDHAGSPERAAGRRSARHRRSCDQGACRRPHRHLRFGGLQPASVRTPGQGHRRWSGVAGCPGRQPGCQLDRQGGSRRADSGWGQGAPEPARHYPRRLLTRTA